MHRALLAILLLTAAVTVEGVEICRFRALDAENPFARWLSSEGVTCVEAGSAAEVPEGLWNVFARSGEAISTAPLLITGGWSTQGLAPELEAAATIAPLLPPGHTGVVYVPRNASAFPVDGARTLVPAERELWLFVLEHSMPVAVLPIEPLAPGEERSVDARSGGEPAVVGWLHIPDGDRPMMGSASTLAPPAVRIRGHHAEPLPRAPLLHNAFYLLRGAEPEQAELILEGRGWVPQRRAIRVRPGITVVDEPLLARGAATVVVHWKTDQDLAALDRSLGSCERGDGEPRMEIVLLKCTPPPRDQRDDSAQCPETVAREEVEHPFGTLRFGDLEWGVYRAQFRYGKLPAVEDTSTVGPMQSSELRLVPVYLEIEGRVTHGGEPLGEDVRIEFRHGSGFAPAGTSKYRAIVTTGVGTDAPIQVRACDGAPNAIVFAEPRTRHDIDIPANTLSIHVSDQFTGEALPDAGVLLEVMSAATPWQPREPRTVSTETLTADERGIATMTAVPAREIRLTVSHPGYEKKPAEPFVMPAAESHEVEVRMVPLRGRRGRIFSSRPFRNAIVVWFSPEGTETERADVAEDGTFAHASEHPPGETMCVVSQSHPLWVMNAPATERWKGPVLQFPDAPARTFRVGLAASVLPGVQRYIGLVVGGVRVPQPVLTLHQTLRQEPSLMTGVRSLHFRAILATGPIEVLLGPTVEEVAVAAREMDIFALPKFANAPREPLSADSSSVIFTLR